MDKREDAGEFYPDGKVISTRPVATGGDVKHSDFADVEPLPERFTDEDVRRRFNQLVSAAKGASAAVVALLLGAAALAAGVTVQTAPKGTIYNDEQIVTNVMFDATGLAEATNVYTKAETEAKIVELAPAPGDYAAVSNAAMNALSRAEAEAGFTEWVVVPATNDGKSVVVAKALTDSGEIGRTGWWCIFYTDDTIRDANDSLVAPLRPSQSPEIYLYWSQIDGGPYTATRTRLPTMADIPTAQINAATATNALQDTAIGDLSNDNAQTRQIVTTWENFLDGSNVVFSITNYLSGSYNLNAAKLRILELREGEYHEVFNSRDEILLHIDDFSNRYVRVALDAIVDEVAARLASKADRDWGKYTSAGGDAPANTVYMTAPNTVFAGGLEYERVAVGEGTICVLTTRGAPVWTQGDEGTFKFQDDGGTNYFGFAKTDSYTIGANTDGITVQGGMVTMNYNITMSGRPCVWYKSSLSSGAWEQLNLPDGSPVAGASHAVTWEANPDPGTQVCYINVGNAPSGFFRATVEVTGEAKFMTNMPADLSGGIISTNTATGVNGVVKPSFNGSSVIWTWSAD